MRTQRLGRRPALEPSLDPIHRRSLVHATLAAAAAVFTLALASTTRADLPPPPSECDHREPGAACAMFDGTAGVCARHEDSRRPGRSWSSCERDANECERLAVGAACRGYLGRVAHCRAFEDAARNRHWRACMVDSEEYAETNAASRAPAANPPSSVPASASAGPRPGASSVRTRNGCNVVPAAPGGGAGASFGASLGLALAFALRRRRAVA